MRRKLIKDYFKMKKLNILLSAALVLGLASCDDKSDLGIMQTNPQLALMTADGVTLAYGSDVQGETLNLPAHKDGNINVITLAEAKDLPETATISYVMQVSNSETFDNVKELKVVDGAVSANDWENAFLSLVGKSPLASDNWIRFAAYVNDGNSVARLGGSNFYYAAKKLSVTPYDLELPIEASYNIVIGGESVAMTHSSKHQYDDPVFSYMLEVSSEQASNGLEWNIVSESGKTYGVSDAGDPTDMSGSIMEDGLTGVINSAGRLKIEVNMLDLTYSISYAFDYIYTPGNANGWGFDNNMVLFTSDYVKYAGLVYVQEQFKMTGQAGWSPLDWGGDADGNMVPGGANITVDTDGLYYVTADIAELKYTIAQVSTIGMIGGFNGWGGDVVMTPSQDYKTWVGEVTASAGDEFKFRMNSDWAINLGGTVDNLVFNGDNLSFTEAGTYNVTLNIATVPYTCTIEKK